jgi:hypothetical protein
MKTGSDVGRADLHADACYEGQVSGVEVMRAPAEKVFNVTTTHY